MTNLRIQSTYVDDIGYLTSIAPHNKNKYTTQNIQTCYGGDIITKLQICMYIVSGHLRWHVTYDT